ncbi:hypothetical protein ES705_10638 [subsurface metagenome]
MKVFIKIIMVLAVLIFVSGCEYQVGWSIGKSESKQTQNEQPQE